MGKRHVVALVGLAAMSVLYVEPASAGRHCRYEGRIFGQGDIVCIRVDGQTRLARCEMVLNNASWNFFEDGCPTAFVAPPPIETTSSCPRSRQSTASVTPDHTIVP